ncbi:hypothetical protein F5Y00DRAFT_232584 [Daldinia vernicosa]|uniref:uncharacterized protein n=1 Tax=Daldinia vernicosa TaxID=114800 RepID=UPI0020086396|nr:uncharacterized protein F5Y00DRAFT_232584 [Daldinia vernicosa]KAI0850530.1 hypothetical protein F5Y00DRAFT_232584 [Daldinia vernicosa]
MLICTQAGATSMGLLRTGYPLIGNVGLSQISVRLVRRRGNGVWCSVVWCSIYVMRIMCYVPTYLPIAWLAAHPPPLILHTSLPTYLHALLVGIACCHSAVRLLPTFYHAPYYCFARSRPVGSERLERCGRVPMARRGMAWYGMSWHG